MRRELVGRAKRNAIKLHRNDEANDLIRRDARVKSFI